MDERDALTLLAEELEAVGDDAAVVDNFVVTTDMLHERTDFPAGTTHYTAGWRAVGVSLSDVAAMGAEATAAVAVYAVPKFDPADLLAFIRGAKDVCQAVGTRYVGGDLDGHQEFTVTTTAVGHTNEPVRRNGATPGDVVCVTGELGRSAVALELFDQASRVEDESRVVRFLDRANDLFQFKPRISAGLALNRYATAMMDSSDGLSRSLHQLAEASDCGFAINADRIPVIDMLQKFNGTSDDTLEKAITFGEDFELIFTLPANELKAAKEVCPVPLTQIGTVVDQTKGVTINGNHLPDSGFTHGKS